VKTCTNFTKVWRTPFPPSEPTDCVQVCEHNRGRTEARALRVFPATATGTDFPFVEQAARLTRCCDSPKKPAEKIETEYLLTSLPKAKLSAQQMLQADRSYWDIETGLHLRLDVSAGEDRSRVRHPTSVLNLAMIRRAVISIAIHWIRQCPTSRKATTSGFFDSMAANHRKKAFSLVTTRHSSALAPS
jgi:predicted transposase YbfD/YdcC